MPRVLPLLVCLAAALGTAAGEEGEDALWADAAPIDVHAHIGSYRGYDVGLDPLLDNVKRFHVRLALVSNLDGADLPGVTACLGEEEANRATLAAVAAHPELRGLAWARPGAPDASPARIEPYLRDHGFVGVKLHPRFNHFAADDPAVDGYLALCQQYRVPAVVHCDEAAPIYRLAKRHPGVPVVLYHSGFFTDHAEAVRTVAESMERKDARLYLETAQVEPAAAVEMVRRVGAARVLFGTDATYYGKDHYRRYTALVRALRAALTEDEFRRVLGGNAAELFRLK